MIKSAITITVKLFAAYQEAYGVAAKAQKNAMILLFVAVFISALIAFFLARRLSIPILNLTKIADEISRGNLSADIYEVNRGDEIGALARAIDRMGISLQLAFDKLKKR